MSIVDFVKKMQITMNDLLETQKQGIVEGMSSLIIKNLNTLHLKDRPIHCSDVKNSKFFIKTEKEWENAWTTLQETNQYDIEYFGEMAILSCVHSLRKDILIINTPCEVGNASAHGPINVVSSDSIVSTN